MLRCRFGSRRPRHRSKAKSTTLDILHPVPLKASHALPPKSRLGQNFLHDHAAIERIVDALGPLDQRTVVEIGPGRGAITDLLATRAERLIAVEVDPALAAALRERFAMTQAQIMQPRVEIVEQDVLTFDFAAASRQIGQPLLVVGNLPYYITSPILLHLAASVVASEPSPLDAAVLMVQREVADRVTAQPETRDYGLLTVLCALHGIATPLFTLPPDAFSPPPEVHSTVFRWRFAPRFQALDLDAASFSRLLKSAFAQKRKTLANNLRAAGYTSAHIARALDQTRTPAQARAEELSPDQFAALHHALTATQ